MASLLTTQARTVDPSTFVNVQRGAFGDVLRAQAADVAANRAVQQTQQQLNFDIAREASRAVRQTIVDRRQMDQQNFQNQIALERARRDARSQNLRDQLTIAQTERQQALSGNAAGSGGLELRLGPDGNLMMVPTPTPLTPSGAQPETVISSTGTPGSQSNDAFMRNTSADPQPTGDPKTKAEPIPVERRAGPREADASLFPPGMVGPMGPAPQTTDSVADFAPISAQEEKVLSNVAPASERAGSTSESLVINDERQAATPADAKQNSGQSDNLERERDNLEAQKALNLRALTSMDDDARQEALVVIQDQQNRINELNAQIQAKQDRVDTDILEQFAANSPASDIAQTVADPGTPTGTKQRPDPVFNLRNIEDQIAEVDGDLARIKEEIDVQDSQGNTGTASELRRRRGELNESRIQLENQKRLTERAIEDQTKSLGKFFTGEYNDDGTPIYRDDTPLTTANRTEINKELKQIQEGKLLIAEAIEIVQNNPAAITSAGAAGEAAQTIGQQIEGFQQIFGPETRRAADAIRGAGGGILSSDRFDDIVDARARLNQIDARLMTVVGGPLTAGGRLSDRDVELINELNTQRGRLFRNPKRVLANMENLQGLLNRLEPIKALWAQGVPVREVSFKTMADSVERGFITERQGWEIANRHTQEGVDLIGELNQLFNDGNTAAAVRVGETFRGRLSEAGQQKIDELKAQLEEQE